MVAALAGCQPTSTEKPLVIRENPVDGVRKAKEIRENTAVQLAPGLTLSLWASDSLAPDPIALSIDDAGRVYLTRTNRQKNSEFDIRGHRDWMIASIGLQSVEDRRAFLHNTFSPERSKENEWLRDLNNDGIHDWHDLTVEQEEVWRLEDESGDGIADVSTRILHDFHEEVTDVAGALLVRKEDVFVGVGPDMWRLKDTDGDGVLDHKESISHGYAVHIGFGGHGMSGVIEGPDGRIYWGIGDIGANLTSVDGKSFKYPNQGVIVRSNPDGSDFEVFASGLRNTHEFVFDEYGNLISSDNDGDHPGESERLVHIVEGSDAGWRSNWQYGKYTDPKNNTYKVWMDEELYKPRWDGQAAYIIPPIMNYHNGPTGMVYNPGTALGTNWLNTFFLVEFVGNPSRSHIWAFRLERNGASFSLKDEQDVLSGILPTGIRFGPDGALYVADWINGWDTKNYGRVWRLDVSQDKNDLEKDRAETKRLMQVDYSREQTESLYDPLFYRDLRIRQKAQFELARRGENGMSIFERAISQTENQLARIHGIWGIGQLARQDSHYAGRLAGLLSDSDPEIVAQAACMLGDVRYKDAAEQLIPLLRHSNPRVRFFAAQALGRMAYQPAVNPILEMLENNNDEDVYIRHSGVLALARIGLIEPITSLADHPSRAMRTAAVLVLRRLGSEKVALFLKDKDEYIVAEAARAINDDWSIEAALPDLAATLDEERFTSEPLLRRAINACLRVGGDIELERLVNFARRPAASGALRAEALATLASWPQPSVLDRVDGRYRGRIERDPSKVRTKVGPHIPGLLKSKDDSVVIATAQMISQLGIEGHDGELISIMNGHKSPDVRSAMLTALFDLKYDDLESVVKRGMRDPNGTVRTTALGLLGAIDVSKEGLPGIIDPIFTRGTLPEQQKVLRVLGGMDLEKSGPVLEKLADRAVRKDLSPGLTLDLLEAIDSTQSETLIAKTEPLRSSAAGGAEAFQETLYGGNAREGRIFFMRNPTAQCARCHAIDGRGGDVGPALTHIGDQLSREQILEALVTPSVRLSPGFGTVSLTLEDGQVVNGILMEERADELILKTAEAEPMEIPVARISKRENQPSSMPPMGSLMTKREIRDMVEFLSSLKRK